VDVAAREQLTSQVSERQQDHGNSQRQAILSVDMIKERAK
jgi:hypothetical protein